MDNWVYHETDARYWWVRSGRRDMSYWRRQASQYGSRMRFFTLWPSSGFMSGDRSPGYCLIGQDMCEIGSWSPPQRAERGNGAMKFIRGTTKTDAGTPLGGVVVQCFLTATDQFVSESASDSNGQYEVGTVYPGQQHYLVAYNQSGNTAGTTVNTLLPTNRDGT